MIYDDDRIMIEAGTTCALIVKYLTGKRGVQVLTNSVLVFAKRPIQPEPEHHTDGWALPRRVRVPRGAGRRARYQ